jgi:hypothetical protein
MQFEKSEIILSTSVLENTVVLKLTPIFKTSLTVVNENISGVAGPVETPLK